MRINVYSQELTSETGLARKVGKNIDGEVETFFGVRIMLVSPNTLHSTPTDDDRSAVTFWLPKSMERRHALAATFERMAHLARFPLDIDQ